MYNIILTRSNSILFQLDIAWSLIFWVSVTDI